MNVSPLTASLPKAPAAISQGAGPAPTADGFGKALTDALGSLDRLQQEADAGALQLAAGESVELHEVLLAQDRASLSMQLAVQVRNKLVEAYQDVMRMQI